MIKGLVDPNEPQFRSPQLLMVSGVGPQEVLVQHNISVLADRPGVGQNMWVCDDPLTVAASQLLVRPLIMH